MRRQLIGAIITTLLTTALSGAHASAECFGNGDGASCRKEVETTEPGSQGSGGGESRGPGGGGGPEMMLYPKIVTGPDAKPCTIAVSVPVPAEKADQEKAYASEMWELLLPGSPLCPAQPGVPAVSPRVLAIGFWQDIPLPKPAPSIAPGWAITGKTAYLETHGERRHDYSRGTPFGSLGLTATGQYYVDWGDGETAGPYNLEGGAWPDGQITHTYINVGHYNIVVTEKWSSTWHLGGESGDLSGLETEGVIDNFRVEQVQAVISGN